MNTQLKNVLIIGGAGYLGSHLNKEFYSNGINTVVLDNLENGRRDFVKWGEFYEGDINDDYLLRKIFSNHKIDLVINCAVNIYNEKERVMKKLSEAELLINIMSLYGVKSIVLPSSHEVYGMQQYFPIDENHPKVPISMQGFLDLQIEEIVKLSCEHNGINYCFIRFQNLAGADSDCEIGESHLSDGLIPSIFGHLNRMHSSVKFKGSNFDTPDGSLIRDYLHVKDAADAFVSASNYIHSMKQSEIFNISNGIGFSEYEIVRIAEKIFARNFTLNYKETSGKYAPSLYIDSNKAFKLLHWTPKFRTIEEIIISAFKYQITRGGTFINSKWAA